MQSSLARAVCQHVARYLDGVLPPSEFDAWFVPATWDVDQEHDPTAYDLTNEIYLRLAEYANGHWTEAELKDLLRPLAHVPAAAG